MSFKKVAIFILLLSLFGCASPIKQIKDSTLPFHRPYFSVLPPQGEGWVYADHEESDNFSLTFFKKYSGTHSLVGLISEAHVNTTFDSPEEFLKFINKANEFGLDPRRYKVINKESVLDNKFGNYSIRDFSVTEDHNAVNRGSNEFLVLNLYGYTFIHPHFNDIVMHIEYSERGLPEEIDSNFKETAKKFIDGLILKIK